MASHASTSASSTGTNHSITWPAVSAHDRAYIIAGADGNGNTYTAPSGFTLIATGSITGPDTQTIFIWEKLDCTGAESGSIAVNSSNGASGNMALGMITLSGRDNTAAVTFLSSFSSNTSANASPISMAASSGTAAAGDDLISAFGTDQDTGTDVWGFTLPSGWTAELVDEHGVVDWSNISINIKENVGAGAVGTVTGTATKLSGSGGAGWGAYVFAVPAAPGGGGGVTAALVTSNDPGPAPRKPMARRGDGWEPLGALAVAAVTGATFSTMPEPPRQQRRVDSSSFLASPAPRGFVFSTSPERQPRPQRIDTRVSPLPAFIAPIAWGYSDTPGPAKRRPAQDLNAAPVVGTVGAVVQTAEPLRGRSPRASATDWSPLAAVTVTSTATSVDCDSPVRSRSATAQPLGWQPLPSIVFAPSSYGFECQPAAPSKALATRVDAWSPLPPPAAQPSVGGFESPPPAPITSRARIDAWTPLDSLLTVSVDVQPQDRQPRARFLPDGWAPLPVFVLGPAVEIQAAGAAPRRQPPRDAWQPLPALIAAAAGGTSPECQAPIAPRRGRTVADGWAPLPAFALGPSVECLPAVSSRRRAPTPEGWQPLPAAIAVAVVGRGPECQAPTPPRLRPLKPEAWAPLPGLPIVVLGAVIENQLAPPARTRRQQPDGWPVFAPAAHVGGFEPYQAAPRARVATRTEAWAPLAPLGFAFVSQSALQPAARPQRRADDWQPLAPLPGAFVDFQPPLQAPSLRRQPVANDWALWGIYVPPVPWCDFDAQRAPIRRAPWSEPWLPLPGMGAASFGGVFARFLVEQTPSGFFGVTTTPSAVFGAITTPSGKFRGT